jgi:hypothetical protein
MTKKILIFSGRVLFLPALFLSGYFLNSLMQKAGLRPHPLGVVGDCVMGVFGVIISVIIGYGIYCAWPKDPPETYAQKLEREKQENNRKRELEKYNDPNFDPLQEIKQEKL